MMNKIKKIFKLKNLLIIFIICILSVLSMFNFSVALYSKNTNEVTVYLNKGDIVNDIILSNNSLNLKKFKNNNIEFDKIVKDEAIEEQWLNIINDTDIKIDMSVIDNLTVEVTSNSEKIKYKINGEEFENIGTTIYIPNSKISVLKDSINNKSAIIFAISFIVFAIIVPLLKYLLDKIKEDKLKLWDIALMLFTVFLIYLSNIYLFMLLNKLLAIIPSLILTLFVLWKFKFNIKEWKNIFLLVTSIVGVMMLFMITPGNVPDEYSHYIRSYVDSVSISKEWKDNAKMPVSINDLMEKFTYNRHSTKIKYSAESYMTELLKSNDYDTLKKSNIGYENTKYLSFLPYLPSTIINVIGRNLRLPVFITFMLCRLINLIVSTMLCYMAIAISPRFKKIFALIAILPIFMQQAIGVDMDYLTDSVAILLIAIILKYRFEDINLGIKDLICIAMVGISLGLCKFGYFPLLILIFMIPNKKFANKKVAIIFKLSLILIPIIISYFANFSAVSNPNTNETEKYTIKTVLLNPINSAKVCVKTLIGRFADDSLSKQIDGFGWSTKSQLKLSLWVLASVYIICLFSDNEESQYLTKKDRIVMLGIFSFIYLILYGIAFTEWTSIISDEITGLQARYFIPILPLFYIAISNNFFKNTMNNKWKFYTISIFISQLLSIMSIVTAFY